MRVAIDSRRKKPDTLLKRWPEAELIDVTSRGELPWRRFSPFFPHGGIPVPFTPGRAAASVEGVWQGLKVFEGADVDEATFDILTMRGIKRTTRKHGRVLGHREGVRGRRLLAYLEARWHIYLPSYRYVLDHHLAAELRMLRDSASRRPVVLLDYETNREVLDLSKPLSHAALIAAFLNDEWPTEKPA